MKWEVQPPLSVNKAQQTYAFVCVHEHSENIDNLSKWKECDKFKAIGQNYPKKWKDIIILVSI